MIQVQNLSYKYPSGPNLQFPDLEVLADETCLILGQSGVGKTTLLHLLAGLMKPSSGSVTLNGTNISNLDGRKLDRFRGEKIGIVFQKNHFVKALSVLDNLLITQKLAGSKVDAKECKSLLEKLNIGQYANKLTDALSEGEKQRVSIARALATRPTLILADEPTSALDDENCNVVFNLLKAHSDQIDASLVIVTHDGRLKDLVDKRVVLQNHTADV